MEEAQDAENTDNTLLCLFIFVEEIVSELWILGTVFHKSTESWTKPDFSASGDGYALHVQHAFNSFLRPTAHNKGRKSRGFVLIESSMSCQQKTAVRFCSLTSRAVFEMPRLSTTERERAIGMLQGKITNSKVARRLNCTKSTIYRLQ